MKKQRFYWTLEKRILLQQWLKEGGMLVTVCREWQALDDENLNTITEVMLRSEIEKGITPEDHAARRWNRYDPMRVYETMIGKDAMAYVIQRVKNGDIKDYE